MKNTHNTTYSIIISGIEMILNILLTKHDDITIDYLDYDIDSAIYYFQNDKLYLINYDSIERKWYLSLLDEKTYDLLEEIYNGNYEDFINYLKIKSHWNTNDLRKKLN